MRILVTGSEGQLGQCIRKAVAHSANEYIFTDVDDFDITDPVAVDLMIRCNDFQVIINCAAFTDVDRAESQEEIAELINATAVGYLAGAARKYNVLLVHISTDYIFGGNINNTPCTEDQTPNPTGAYGRTKLHGEQAITESGCRHIILRTAWLYSDHGRNFVKTIMSLSAEKKELKVVVDQTGTPTNAHDLAGAIVGIIDNNLYDGNEGIYHYSNEGVCSWYDFAEAIVRIAGHTDCNIQPCSSNEFPSPVKRPAYSVLDKTKIRKTFGIKIPYWNDSLKKCIDQLNELN